MHLSKTSRISLVFFFVLGGCEPTCEEVCDKLVACGDLGTEREPAAECKAQCLEQKQTYATWTDTQLRESFTDELSCLKDASCDDIAAGVCYDEDVWSF